MNSVSTYLSENCAQYHKNCYNNIKRDQNETASPSTTPAKYFDNQTPKTRQSPSQLYCFLCDKPDKMFNLYRFRTKNVQRKVLEAAEYLKDPVLLSKLSTGDLNAQDSRYHLHCLNNLYEDQRKKIKEDTKCNNDNNAADLVFAEICVYIQSFSDVKGWSILLKDVCKLYDDEVQKRKYKLAAAHATRLKEKLMENIPSLIEIKSGRSTFLSYSKKTFILKISESDKEILKKAVEILREHLFSSCDCDNVLDDVEQELSFSAELLYFMQLLLNGNDDVTEVSQPVLTICQLIKFNSVKRRKSLVNCRHNQIQETPLPIYIGTLLHSMRKAELINKLHKLGLSISYDRVKQLTANMCNSVCDTYYENGLVCPPHLKKNEFITAAMDNIDHNLSSTTSKDSFHGTGISINTHLDCDSTPVTKTVYKLIKSNEKKLKPLPMDYTLVKPYSLKPIPAIPTIHLDEMDHFCDSEDEDEEDVTVLDDEISIYNDSLDYVGDIDEKIEFLEKDWTNYVHDALFPTENEETSRKNITWAGFNASKSTEGKIIPAQTALLPLFNEKADSPAMVYHTFRIVKSITDHLNPNQSPVLYCDQPIFAVAKHLQWTEPEFAEDKMVIMFGGLHIEMNTIKTLGKLLEGSEWDEVIAEADIASRGTAQSFLSGTHVTRCRNAHQVTLASLSIMIRQSFEKAKTNCKTPLNFEDWTKSRCGKSPQFLYWKLIMDLQAKLLTLIRSIREGNFALYIESLRGLIPIYFALDNYKYARWLTVHLHDMLQLEVKHPEIYAQFCKGNFAIHKTSRRFSAMAVDQCHEQQNELIKGDGGAVGLLTGEESALHYS